MKATKEGDDLRLAIYDFKVVRAWNDTCKSQVNQQIVRLIFTTACYPTR
jgi:hypothetical protein